MRGLVAVWVLASLAVGASIALGGGLQRPGSRTLGEVQAGSRQASWTTPKGYWFTPNHGLQNNWAEMIGIDTNEGVLDTTSITATISERIEYYDNPPGWLSAEFLSKTSEYILDQARSHNPDFQWLMYFNYAHVDSTLANDPDARPFAAYKDTVLTPWIAKDKNAGNFAIWFADGATPGVDPPTTYAVDYVTDTDPPGVDYARIDTYLEGWWSDFIKAMQTPPQGVMLDYIFNPTVGFQWYTDANDTLDLDQDGLGYFNDANEQAAFKAAQQYYIDRIRMLGGANFLILANGRWAWPDEGDPAEVLARLDGFYAEKYPFTVWSSIRMGDALTQIYVEDQTHPYRRTEPVMLLDLFNDFNYSHDYADDQRFTALMFNCQFFPRVRYTFGAEKLDDPTWDSYVNSLGTALQPPVVSSGTPGHPTDPYVFARLFQNAILTVTVDQDAAAVADRIVGEIVDY